MWSVTIACSVHLPRPYSGTWETHERYGVPRATHEISACLTRRAYAYRTNEQHPEFWYFPRTPAHFVAELSALVPEFSVWLRGDHVFSTTTWGNISMETWFSTEAQYPEDTQDVLQAVQRPRLWDINWEKPVHFKNIGPVEHLLEKRMIHSR